VKRTLLRLKAVLKRLVIGQPGLQPCKVRRGLLRGLAFHIDAATKSQRLLGLDELEITSAVCRLAADARSALDIGANDGWYSLYFASCPNIVQVVAFEPCADLVERAQKNFALNDPELARKLNWVQKKVGNANDETWCSIDHVVKNLPHPVLLKIDVDGGELEVLLGSRQLLALRYATLIIETHSKNLEDDCLTLLTGFGYDVRIIRNGWYRRLIPETRELVHNRWLVAQPRR
jgi:hypothetical protein